jgi:drug/metabolite transporter (DMT)-like permease
MQWIWFTLLNVFANGSVIFFTKSAVKQPKIGYSGVMFASLFFACLIYLPIFLINYLSNPVISSAATGYFLLLASIFLSIINFFIYVHAIAINDLSVFGPLDSIRPFFVILFSSLLLSQQPTLFIFLGTILIFLGVLILTISRKFFREVENFKKTFFVVLSSAMFGFISIIDKKTMVYISPINYVFFVLLSVCIANGIVYFLKTKNINFKPLISYRFFGMGILWVIGYLGIMTAIKIASPNQTIPLQMTRSLYLSFLGFMFLKEKGYFKKIAAALVMLAGVYFLVQ